MKKHIFFFIGFLIVSICMGQTDTNYALLKIYRGDVSYSDSVKVKVYNQEPFNVPPMTVVTYKVYSKGGFVITATNGKHVFGFNGNSNNKDPSCYVSVEHGNTYYLIVNPFAGNNMVKLVDEDKIKEKFGGERFASIKFEEDRNKPIKGGSTQPYSSGTGFLISGKGYIITNSHVVYNSKKITVRGIGGDFTTKHTAKIVVDDKSNDIALLQLESSELKLDSVPFGIRSSGVETGEEIFVLGYPLKKVMGEEIKLSTGVVSSKSGYKGEFNTYQVSASVQPGNSGSPLFDRNGNLIGIVNAKLEGTESVNYAIKISYLKSIIESSETPTDLNKIPLTTPAPLVDLVKKYSSYIYIIETEK